MNSLEIRIIEVGASLLDIKWNVGLQDMSKLILSINGAKLKLLNFRL